MCVVLLPWVTRSDVSSHYTCGFAHFSSSISSWYFTEVDTVRFIACRGQFQFRTRGTDERCERMKLLVMQTGRTGFVFMSQRTLKESGRTFPYLQSTARTGDWDAVYASGHDEHYMCRQVQHWSAYFCTNGYVSTLKSCQKVVLKAPKLFPVFQTPLCDSLLVRTPWLLVCFSLWWCPFLLLFNSSSYLSTWSLGIILTFPT